MVVYRIYGEDLTKEELFERDQSDEIIESARKDFGIRIWYITRLISELKYYGKMRGSRDDILRLLELVSHFERDKEKAWSRAERKAWKEEMKEMRDEDQLIKQKNRIKAKFKDEKKS